MGKCVVQGCSNRKGNGLEGRVTHKRFFSFPSDPGRVKVWLAAIRQTERDPSGSGEAEICEDHFLADHITSHGISEDAIPLPPYLDGPLGVGESSEGEPDGADGFTAPIDSDGDDDDECDEDFGEQEEDDEDEDGYFGGNQPGEGKSAEARLSLTSCDQSSASAKKNEGNHEPESRFDVSLTKMTHIFMRLMNSAPDGVLDLNEAARKMGLRKRRVYDITNVLSGIQLIEKKSASKIHWVSSIPVSCFSNAFGPLNKEAGSLKEQEENLDRLIRVCAKQLFSIAEDKDNANLAYVTHEDLSFVNVFQDQTIIAVRAPEETRLDVPMPREDGIYMHLKATQGPIYVQASEMPGPKTFAVKEITNPDKMAGFVSLESSRIRTCPLKKGPTPTPEPVQSA